MGYGYGISDVAIVVSGTAQLISAGDAPNATRIRVLDAVLINTASVVSLYAGTSSDAANLLLVLDRNTTSIGGIEGYLFKGGVYCNAAGGVGNVATLTYIREF